MVLEFWGPPMILKVLKKTHANFVNISDSLLESRLLRVRMRTAKYYLSCLPHDICQSRLYVIYGRLHEN